MLYTQRLNSFFVVRSTGMFYIHRRERLDSAFLNLHTNTNLRLYDMKSRNVEIKIFVVYCITLNSIG